MSLWSQSSSSIQHEVHLCKLWFHLEWDRWQSRLCFSVWLPCDLKVSLTVCTQLDPIRTFSWAPPFSPNMVKNSLIKIIHKSMGDVMLCLCLFAPMFFIYHPYYFVTTNHCKAPLLASCLSSEYILWATANQIANTNILLYSFLQLTVKSQQNVLLLIPCCVFACKHFYSEMCNWGLSLNVNDFDSEH